jgi:hypothetical protein
MHGSKHKREYDEEDSMLNSPNNQREDGVDYCGCRPKSD